MKKVITISSAELFLKKKNHHTLTFEFIETIRNRISNLCDGITIQKDNNMINIANFDKEVELQIIDKLKIFPGIDFIRIGWRFVANIKPQEILNHVELFKFKSNETFKVVIKSDIEKPDKNVKEEYINTIANYFITKYNLKVNLNSPDNIFEYKTTKKASYFYYKKLKGRGGFYQGGNNNKIICLLSGGVDSILATLLMAYRGCRIITLSLSLEDNTEFLEKVKKVNKELHNIIDVEKSYVVTVEELKQELMHLTEQNYRMIILKRVFLKIATLIAKEEDSKALVMGDSLNQVASQTLLSMTCIDEATEINVFRPLLAYTKIEIENKLNYLSNNLYLIGKKDVIELCEQFHPSTVITQPRITKVKHIEKKHYLLNSLVELCYKKNVKELSIRD